MWQVFCTDKRVVRKIQGAPTFIGFCLVVFDIIHPVFQVTYTSFSILLPVFPNIEDLHSFQHLLALRPASK